jgi:hypothetical protein
MHAPIPSAPVRHTRQAKIQNRQVRRELREMQGVLRFVEVEDFISNAQTSAATYHSLGKYIDIVSAMRSARSLETFLVKEQPPNNPFRPPNNERPRPENERR